MQEGYRRGVQEYYFEKKNLKEGINAVHHGKLVFDKDAATSKWTCSVISPLHEEFSSASPNLVDCNAYMVGDLKFMSMMLGKEDFDSYWCYVCSLCHAVWQDEGHADGFEWSLEKLKEQEAKVKEGNLEGRPRLGVRENPYFDIPVSQFVWPLLHTLIGIGNNILKYLVDYADTEIQHTPVIEIRLRKELGKGEE